MQKIVLVFAALFALLASACSGEGGYEQFDNVSAELTLKEAREIRQCMRTTGHTYAECSAYVLCKKSEEYSDDECKDILLCTSPTETWDECVEILFPPEEEAECDLPSTLEDTTPGGCGDGAPFGDARSICTSLALLPAAQCDTLTPGLVDLACEENGGLYPYAAQEVTTMLLDMCRAEHGETEMSSTCYSILRAFLLKGALSRLECGLLTTAESTSLCAGEWNNPLLSFEECEQLATTSYNACLTAGECAVESALKGHVSALGLSVCTSPSQEDCVNLTPLLPHAFE